MGVNAGAGQVFNWFANMTSVAGLMTWFGITVTYVRFYAGMKAQGYDRKKLPYASGLQPYAAWYAMVMCLLVCFVSIASIFASEPSFTISVQIQFSGWKVFLKGNWVVATFVTNYLPLVLFPILYLGAKLWTRQPVVRADEMDFVSGLSEIEADS